MKTEQQHPNLDGRLLQEILAMRHNTLVNYIQPGLMSSLVGGPGGSKVRVFEASRDAQDWITPHSHRFSFTSLVLRGSVCNTIFTRAPLGQLNADQWCVSTIDQVCGANGLRDYVHTRETSPTWFSRKDTYYDQGDVYHMEPEEIHSIRFEKGSVVLFFESAQKTTTGTMLEPWVNGKCVPTFRTEDWMFEKVQP